MTGMVVGMRGRGPRHSGSGMSSLREALGATASDFPPCMHYAEDDQHGDPVRLPDPAPGVADQWMRIVLVVGAHAHDGFGFHGFNVRPGGTVRAVPGTIVLHTYSTDPHRRGRSARAFRLDDDGTWVDIAGHAGVEWAITIRDRVRALVVARECPLCARAAP